MKKIIVGSLCIIVGMFIVTSGCIQTETPKQLQIVTSFYPLYYLAQEIVGDKATVTMLIPDNVEPHTWEPTSSDIISMEHANVFIYNGGGFEPWVNDFLSAIQNPDLVIVDTSTNVQLQLSAEIEEQLSTATTLFAQGPFQHIQTTMTTDNTPVVNLTNICLNLTLVTTTDHYEGYFALSIDEDGEYSFIQNSVGTYTITHQTNGILKAELSIDSPVDYEVISHADVYDLEPGMYHIHIPTSSFNTLQMVIVAADHEEHAGEDQDKEHHHEDEHHHGSTDPHFWLDPLRAKIQVDNILTGIISADPENATYYTQHATALKERLDGLHTNFTKGLQNRQKNDIITTHEGFNYLAKRYGFTAHAAIGISGDEQPSTQDLAHLIEIMDELDLNYVFVEPIYADEYMTTIARETGASVLVLDGLHGRTGVHATMDYFQIMEENLKHLQTGLEVSN